MSYPTVTGLATEGTPYREAQSCLGPNFASSTYQFFVTGTSTPANVYQDGALATPFPITGYVTSDMYGRFPPIYLDPSVVYRVQLYNSANALQWQSDPYYAPLPTTGSSGARGLQIATTGEMTIPAPSTGGSGISLTLKSGATGTAALRLNGTLAGNSALIINSSATTGAQTATFAATNKPGTATSAVAGWLPITCDGVQYYAPVWHGNPFTPYGTGGGGSGPAGSAQGETINASSVTFTGTGLTTATNGTANPSNWYSPVANGVGAGYYINITKTGGLSGLAFSAAQGAWTNITGSGLTISSNAAAQITGTYQLSTSATGSPVAASGTIALSGNSGVIGQTYNGTTPLMLDGDGTATLNGASSSNWYSPTTANIGAGYYVKITQTSGTSGYSFSAANGTYANITNSGLSIGVSGPGGSTYTISGNYSIASDSGGVNVLGTGTITLTGGSNVQSSNWSGTTPLNLAGNGAATLNGSSTSSWYSPNASNVGSGYYINITRTGGTSGVNFTAAQGSWTNITNSGLSINMSGYTGDVGTVTVSGTYQISSSVSGTPVLGSGTVALSVSGLTVLHVYTTAGSGTETIPTGATTCTMEAWSGVSGGGGGSLNSGSGGGGGGGGAGPAYARSVYTVSGHSGQTVAYTVGAAGTRGSNVYSGTAGNGTAGGTSSISSGTFSITTMTCTAGGYGIGGTATTGGAGGAASSATGGNAVNSNGGAGGASVSHGAGAAGTYYGSPVYSGTPSSAGNNTGGDGVGDSGGIPTAGIVSFYYA